MPASPEEAPQEGRSSNSPNCILHNCLTERNPATDRVCYCCQRTEQAKQYHTGCSLNDSLDSHLAGFNTFLSKDYSPNLYLDSIIRSQRTRKRRRRPKHGYLFLPPAPGTLDAEDKHSAHIDDTSFVSKPRNLLKETAPSYFASLLKQLFILASILIAIGPTLQTSVNTYQVLGGNSLQPYGKNSGQFQISQLCSHRSPFPIHKRVEGAVLSAGSEDTDTNCTITFRTKSAQQHFVIRFEELKLSCADHLVLFDGDLDYGQPSIKDFSCRDNMASVPVIKTTGTFLTVRYSSDGQTKTNDGFRLVVTAVFDVSLAECPVEYVTCRSQLCISRSLFCDGINHCLDNSDELGCHGQDDQPIELPYALGFFVMLILIISTGVIVCILLHCRRDSHSAAAQAQAAAAAAAGLPYAAQYQHQLQRAFGVQGHPGGQVPPMHASSSFMFPASMMSAAGHQPQYQQFFQASPYVTPQHRPLPMQAAGQPMQATPQHAALIATLPRGYSTLPLNMLRPQAAGGHLKQPQTILANSKAANEMIGAPQEYVMMTGLAGPMMAHHHQHHPAAHMQMAMPPVSNNSMQQQQQQQRNQQIASMANSQSILSSSTTATNATAIRQRGNSGNHQQVRSSPPTSSSSTSQTTTREAQRGNGSSNSGGGG